MKLVEMLEQQLEELVTAKLGDRKHPLFEDVLDQHRKLLCEFLLEPLASVAVVKEEPTPEIIERAKKLQALALGSTSGGEQTAAWTAFQKLWQKYNLPLNLGL